jgi:enoyl-CoA hydratase
MSDPAVKFSAEGAIGVITLNRPDNRNSMTPELLDAFAAAGTAARTADVRCVVVTGTGSCFSSGADFKSTVQRDGGHRAPNERSYAMYESFLSLLDIAVPVIGALNGHTVGGGFGLALVCDLRIGARDAKYGANFVKLGLSPGMAISYLLPRVVGASRAAELMFTGRLVDGDEAERLGILTECHAAAEVLPRAMAIARAIAANAPLAVRETRRGVREILALPLAEAYRRQEEIGAPLRRSEDAREAQAAFVEKRAPKFRGR